MTNISLPEFPALANGAVFVKGFANNGLTTTASQYVTFGHSFQKGQIASGGGLSALFTNTSVPCQIDVKTSYSDGSVCHALITVQAQMVVAGEIYFAQFFPASPPSGAALSLATALGSHTVSISLVAAHSPDWAPFTTYTPGNLITPTAGNAGGYTYQSFNNLVATPETSAASEPAWPQTPGASVSDGGVNWVNIGTPFIGTITQDLVVLVRDAAPDLWLLGPLAVQGRAWAVLQGRLRVQVDMTAYADGSVLADVMVANDVATLITSGRNAYGGTQAYTATLMLNGNVAFTSQPLTHYLYQNWSWQVGSVPHVVNSSQENVLQIIHDPNDFIAAQATQSYNTTLGVWPTDGTYQAWPVQAAEYAAASGFGQPLINPVNATNEVTLVDQNMGGVGGRPDVGLNDAWCCWWFVTQNSVFAPTSFECVKVNGAIPWHFWNPATGEYWTTDDEPAILVGTTTKAAVPPFGSNDWDVLLAEVSTNPNWALNMPHFPELAYLPYLLSGRRYALDELNAVTSWCETGTAQSRPYRNYDQGLTMRQGEVRGASWSMRNFLYATYANPDGSAMKCYFRRMLDNNLYWFLTQISTYQAIQGPECFGWYPSWAYGAQLSNWEESYLFSSLSMAAIMGHPIALQICQWMANYFIGLFTSGTNSPPTGLPPADAVVYDMTVFQYYGDTQNGEPYSWGNQYLPAQNWAAIESLIQEVGRSNIVNVVFSGSVSGTTLTVSEIIGGEIEVGQVLFYNGISSTLFGTIMIESGAGSSWQINQSLSLGSQTMTSSFPGPFGGTNTGGSGVVSWFPGMDGGSGSYGDYGQLLWITLVNYITLGNPNAASCLNMLQTMTAADGTNVPYIDEDSWAGANGQCLTMVVQRTLNDSQILPFAAAPSSDPLTGNPVLGTLTAAATITSSGAQADTLFGTAMIGGLRAVAAIALGSNMATGTAELGAIMTYGLMSQQSPGGPAIDGSNSVAAYGSSWTVDLSTSKAGDLICVALFVEEDVTPSISDTAGLAWGTPYSVNQTGKTQVFVWLAPAAAALANDAITVSIGSGSKENADLCAFGISGTPSRSYLDPNASIPSYTANFAASGVALSTSKANDLVLVFLRSTGALTSQPIPSAGFTSLFSVPNSVDSVAALVAYQIASAPQSGLSCTIANSPAGSYVVGIGLAIVAEAVSTDTFSGGATLGAVSAAGLLALPSYAELTALLSAADSTLESIQNTIRQWETT